jgi:hypothetical protein
METKIIPHISASISGLPKSGKTYLGLTWPEPILVYSFEHGAQAVIDKKFPGKKIDVIKFKLPIIESDNPAPYAEKLWEDFQKHYKDVVYSGKYNTIVIDTATHLWALLRQAITEAKNRKKLLEVEYALPNLKMGAIFTHANEAGVNLVVINYLKDRYVKGENTGEMELNGWSQTEGLVDVVLEIARKTTGSNTKMLTCIKDNRFDRDVNGQTFIDTTYDELITCLGV